ncbi:MAG: class I SAM-dependent methyltransferase [Xanthobacteraceae bacterium]
MPTSNKSSRMLNGTWAERMAHMVEAQPEIDAANAAFWNELCGSTAARAWGITDNSMDSLRRYDENYFRFYPYLERHIRWGQLRGKRVLEVGLGYGTVSQKLAESGAIVSGLDIATNPVAMVNHRLGQSGLPGEAKQGSILNPPFPEGAFDAIVAIGCLHHTGNMRAGIESCRRLLAPGGRLIGMVYYAYSYRQLWTQPRVAAHVFVRELAGRSGIASGGDTFQYDHSADGSLAPSTEFVSKRTLRSLCAEFEKFWARTENIDREPPFAFWSRDRLLQTPLPRLCGLDIYWSCHKPGC